MGSPPSAGCFALSQIGAVDPRWLVGVAPAPAHDPASSWSPLLSAALDAPVASPSLESLQGRVVIVISDATRDEPREAFLDALLPRLGAQRVTLLVASGTHQPRPMALAEKFRAVPMRVHDARDESQLCLLGVTSRGTPIRLARELIEADHVISTGRLRPHYFAGFSGGVKGVFPGCAGHAEILRNHMLKAEADARLGSVERNPCRADMEEAAGVLGPRLLILNALADVEGAPVAAAFGDPIAAHRRLAARAQALFGVPLKPRRVLVLADQPPLSSSLYQASKMLAVAEHAVLPGGIIIMLAECDAGTGPLERVNQGIFELGLRPRLPRGVRVRLVSTLDAAEVQRTYAGPARSLGSELSAAGVSETDPALLVWRAGECIPASR